MSGPDPREATILARCSRYAAQYLVNLREHPLYLKVLDRLEASPGALFELDVEGAFYESVRAKMRQDETTLKQSE
jgi:hypothetical protein